MPPRVLGCKWKRSGGSELGWGNQWCIVPLPLDVDKDAEGGDLCEACFPTPAGQAFASAQSGMRHVRVSPVGVNELLGLGGLGGLGARGRAWRRP